MSIKRRKRNGCAYLEEHRTFRENGEKNFPLRPLTTLRTFVVIIHRYLLLAELAEEFLPARDTPCSHQRHGMKTVRTPEHLSAVLAARGVTGYYLVTLRAGHVKIAPAYRASANTAAFPAFSSQYAPFPLSAAFPALSRISA